MEIAILFLGAITTIVFMVLAGVALAANPNPKARSATRWLSFSFAVIAIVSLIGLLLPQDGAAQDELWFDWILKIEVAFLVLFPYALHRFSRFFRKQKSWLEKVFIVTTSSLIVATFVLPYVPNPGDQLPVWFIVYAIAFLAHWALVSISASWMLWEDGRNKPGVIKSRMNLLALASIAMTIALLAAGFGGVNMVLQVSSQALALVSGFLFFLGYRPPTALKIIWRKKDQELLREAISGLMASTSKDEVVESLLPPIMNVVGGQGAALINDEGSITHNYQSNVKQLERIGKYLNSTRNTISPYGELENSTALYHRHDHGWLVVFTGRATPFLGEEEFQLIKSVLALTDLALARVTLFEKEREAVERLEKLDQLKTEFVAMVAHDLRSPMAVIAGFADVLQKQRSTLTEAQQDEFLKMISDTIRRLSLLVEDILQVARIESGEFKYQYESFDLSSLARQAAFEQETANPGRVIEVRAAPVPNVYADPHRITQVIYNLIGNALKFSPPEKRVIVDISSKGGYCYFTVEDQGMGIADEDLSRLFTKFSRITPPDGAPKTPGTGLGLFISKSMIEAQHGEIWVESVPGQGSVFGFKLPLAKNNQKQMPKAAV